MPMVAGYKLILRCDLFSKDSPMMQREAKSVELLHVMSGLWFAATHHRKSLWDKGLGKIGPPRAGVNPCGTTSYVSSSLSSVKPTCPSSK